MSDQKNGSTAEQGGTVVSEIEEQNVADGGTGNGMQDDPKAVDATALFKPEKEEDLATEGTENTEEKTAKKQSDGLNLDDLFDPDKQDALLDEVLSDGSKESDDARSFVKKTTQKSMEVAAERREVERERGELQTTLAEMRDLKQQLQQMAAMQQAPMAQTNQQQPEFDGYDADGEPMSPAVARQMAAMQQQMKQMQDSMAVMNLDMNTRSVDGLLQNQYEDYDPRQIDSVIQNLDHGQLREVVYKAQRLDGLDITKIEADAERRGAEKMLQKIRSINKTTSEKGILDPVRPGAGGGGQERKGTPKTFEEAAQNAKDYPLFK